MLGLGFSWRRSYAFVVFSTIAIVSAADFLLYNHTLGWTAAAVAALMFAAIALRNARFLRTTGGQVFAVLMVGLLVALVEQPTWLNIAYALLCLAALAIINSSGWEPDFWPWIGRIGRWLGVGWAQVFLDNGLVVRFLLRRGVSPRTARGIAAWIVPGLLASVFVAIFAIGNPILAQWLSTTADWIGRTLSHLPDLISLSRFTFWLGFATLGWMLQRGRVRPRGRHTAKGSTEAGDETVGEPWRALIDTRPPHLYIPPAFVVRCLLLFNVVFALENVLDLRYLFDPSKLPPGTSYTEYVHRGAYPLIAAAILAGAFVLFTFRPHSETERSRACRGLVYGWIGQTILLTLTASWRLVVYVKLYELTRLRIASAIWFGLVSLGLSFIVWRIVRQRSNAWLVNINALTALAVLYPCCFLNFDGYIADFNARHCAESGGPGIGLDIEYLYHLGTPALPALDRMTDRIALEPRRQLARRLSEDLHRQLACELEDWHSWTWRRQRSERAAEEVAAEKSGSPRTPRLAQAVSPGDPSQ
jgi:hypothetical protein